MGRRGARLLAVFLVLGLCALAMGRKPSPCRCSRINPSKRKECGFPSITMEQCFVKGCCYDHKVGSQKPMMEQCIMEDSARKDCGYPGITPEICASRGCCFSNRNTGVPWCYFPSNDCYY